MKKGLFFTFFLAFTITGFTQSFTPINTGSTIQFGIKNFGSKVTGTFTGLSGFILYNPLKTSSTIFNVQIDATTINTGNAARDKHLKKEDYFNVSTFKIMSFLSSKVTATADAAVFKVEGYLTIKGIKKVVSFPFTIQPNGSGGYFFTGEFIINRKDYTVGGSSLVLADNVTVSLKINGSK